MINSMPTYPQILIKPLLSSQMLVWQLSLLIRSLITSKPSRRTQSLTRNIQIHLRKKCMKLTTQTSFMQTIILARQVLNRWQTVSYYSASLQHLMVFHVNIRRSYWKRWLIWKRTLLVRNLNSIVRKIRVTERRVRKRIKKIHIRAKG